MGVTKDILGKKFNRLEVWARIGRDAHRNTTWACRCDCGNFIVVASRSVTSNNTRSCGCFHIDQITTHGMSYCGRNTVYEYGVWGNMRNRCNNPNDKDYPKYGGRGIKVCERWNSFENFLTDMGKCPDGYQIERRNNNDGYHPDNCYWATRKVQNRNKRTNRNITYNDETLCVTEWAERLGIKSDTLFSRLDKGWSVERAFTKSVRVRS
jgi:hypothetical protein